MKLLLAFFVMFSTLFVGGCSSLTGLFFYPQTSYVQTPSDTGLPYEEVTMKAVDGTELTSWFLPAKDNSISNNEHAPIVLFLHGNAENISTHIGSVYWLPEDGVDVFLLDYRGFGHSNGEPYIPAIFQDVEAALIWLRQKYPERRIYLLGQSIGAAIATTSMSLFESEYNLSGLILDASLTGYRDIAQHVTSSSPLTWIVWPFTWLLPTKWDPIDHIDQVSSKPILMFHSRADGILPYDSARELFEKAKEPKLWQESQGGHIQSFNFEEYRDVLLKFLNLDPKESAK